MIKTHFPEDHEGLAENSEGLVSFLQPDSRNITKSASAAVDRETVNRFKPDNDHVAVHLVALGAYERYGYNKNIDAFYEAPLRKYHQTFVSHGNVFREHQNKDPKKRIGLVKHAAYNGPMARVELIVWLNKKASEKECEDARNGKELSWSMSARMKNDRCSICSNKARHQDLYCDCLKYNLGKYIKPMRKYAYAINEDNLRFFDISKVRNRADRTASYLQYHFGDDMQKAASHGVMGGADIAQAMGFTEDLYTPFDSWSLTELRKAAAFARPSVPLAPLTDTVLKQLREHDLRHVLGGMMKRGCVLDYASFSAMVLDQPLAAVLRDHGFRTTVKAANDIPGMCNAEGCDCGEAGSMVEPDSCGTECAPAADTIDRLIGGVEQNLGLSKAAQAGRLLQGLPSYASDTALTTAQTPLYTGVAAAYQWYLSKAATHLAGTDQVGYGDFGGVLLATSNLLAGKSLASVHQNP